MLYPTLSAFLTKLIFDRNLKGIGWKPGSAKWLGLAYLLPILYGAVVYGIARPAAIHQESVRRWV